MGLWALFSASSFVSNRSMRVLFFSLSQTSASRFNVPARKFQPDQIAAARSHDKARDYVSWIGDTPEVDANGLVLVRDDHGNVIDAIQPTESE